MKPDCRTCGACCWSMHDENAWANVTPAEEKRLPRRLPIVDGAIATQWKTQRAGPFRGIEANVCAALRGSLMHRVSCSVYEIRPRVCRTALKPGERACLQIRGLFADFIQRLGAE